MLHNDISNVAGVVIAFRYEDTLAIPKKGVVNKIVSLFKDNNVDLDQNVFNSMMYIYRDTPYSCDLVIQKEHYDKNTKKLLESVPYSRVVVIDKDIQVTQRLKMGDLNLYVDNNEYRRSTINSEYAIPLRDLNKYMSRRRYK